MANIMNRGDIIDAVAAEADMPQTKIDDVLKKFEGAIARQLAAGGEVRIAGFGSFKVSYRAARTSRNPRTGEPVEVAARMAARFVPGKNLKEAAESSGDGQNNASKEPASDSVATKAADAKKGTSKSASAKTAAEKSDAPKKATKKK